MTTFHIITLFPEAFDSYLRRSIVGRAQKGKKIKIKFYNPRDFVGAKGANKYRQVDDRPFGGGAGMVLMAEPILCAVDKARGGRKAKIILLSAKGKQFNQKMADDWSKKHKELVLISGRYEGIDERVKTALQAEEVSLGPYVLTDGDVAAMAIVSAVARLIPGVIKLESLQEESHWNLLLRAEASGKHGLEYPHYTRPEVLVHKGKKYRVPKVLLSGDHQKIKEWRRAPPRAG